MKTMAFVACVGVLMARPAAANDEEPLRYAIEWDAPDGCAGRTEMQTLVEARLGRKADEGAPELVVVGHVTGQAGSFLAELSLKTAGGEVIGTRRVHGKGDACRSLDTPVSLVAAMMLNVRRKELDLFVPAAPPPPSPPAPRAPPPPRPGRPAPWSADLGVLGDLWLGVCPGVAGGVSARIGFAHSSGVALALEPSVWVGEPNESDGGRRIDFWGAEVAVTARWILRSSVLDLGPRIAFYGGVVNVQASGYDVNREGTRAYLAAGGGLELERRLGPVLLFLIGEADFPIIHDHLDVQTTTGSVVTAYQTSDVGARFSLGIAWVFR